MMNYEICGICKTENPISETKYWKVFLGDDQAYLGRCFVALKRHCGDLAELTQEELLEFLSIIQLLEYSVRKSFGAEMFNWACLMNNAYKNNPPNPHIHWHFIPRYRRAVEFEGLTFTDPEFAKHYDRNRKFEVSEEITQKIIEKIKKNL